MHSRARKAFLIALALTFSHSFHAESDEAKDKAQPSIEDYLKAQAEGRGEEWLKENQSQWMESLLHQHPQYPLWKSKGMTHYTLKGIYARLGIEFEFETVIQDGQVKSYKESGKDAPVDRAITVEALFATALRYDARVDQYDEEFGFPKWVSTGNAPNSPLDSGFVIRVTEFTPTPNPE